MKFREIEELHAARRRLVSKERKLAEKLGPRLLAEIFSIFERRDGARATDAPAPAPNRRQNRGPARCPHCRRSFALRLHLGRHVQATHGLRLER